MTQTISSSVYIHWPYCKKLCSYCNFNKYLSKGVNHSRMRNCLVTELKTVLNLAGINRVTSVFFGGGTPSLAEPATIASIISNANHTASLDQSCEISMEVNPTVMEESKLKDFRHAGVNRVSIGIQTLDKCGLKILGREHSHIESLRCLETAKRLFSSKVSIDLIFGWPGQTLNDWLYELERVLPLSSNHISLYQLTLERGTPLYKQVHNGSLHLPAPEVQEDMYISAIETLARFGFERYEISNFTRKNHYSKHNMSYWSGHQYIGIGPGAHSRFRPAGAPMRQERVQTPAPEPWMAEVEAHGHGTRRARPLTTKEQLTELLASGLRTKWGISSEMWLSIDPNQSINDVFLKSELFSSLVKNKLLEHDKSGLRATDSGLNILDTVLTDLIYVLEQNYKGPDMSTT